MSNERRIMPADQPERGGFIDLATQTLAHDIARGTTLTDAVGFWTIA